MSNKDTRRKLDEAFTGAPWIIYVVPSSWYLPDIPINHWHEIPTENQGGHTTPDRFESGKFKILFTLSRTHDRDSRGQRIIQTAHGREPIVRVLVNVKTSEVLKIDDPPKTVVWGDIPTPIF